MLTFCSLDERIQWMVDGVKTKPLPEVVRERERNAIVGMVLKAHHDGLPPETGVTKLPELSREDKVWKKNAQRYQYRKGMIVEVGEGKKKNVGGKFTTAPDNAPASRKRKKPAVKDSAPPI